MSLICGHYICSVNSVSLHRGECIYSCRLLRWWKSFLMSCKLQSLSVFHFWHKPSDSAMLHHSLQPSQSKHLNGQRLLYFNLSNVCVCVFFLVSGCILFWLETDKKKLMHIQNENTLSSLQKHGKHATYPIRFHDLYFYLFSLKMQFD